jgi:hypothetical protein
MAGQGIQNKKTTFIESLDERNISPQRHRDHRGFFFAHREIPMGKKNTALRGYVKDKS